MGLLGHLLLGVALPFPLSGTVTSVIVVLRLPSERKLMCLPLGKGDPQVDTLGEVEGRKERESKRLGEWVEAPFFEVQT